MSVRPPYRPFLQTLAFLSAPLVLALAVLVAWTGLSSVAATVACLFCLFVMAAILWRHFRHLTQLTRQASAFAREAADGGRPVASSHSTATTALDDALVDAMRAWRQRRDELERLLQSNRAIVDTLPDPLITVAHDRRILKANPAATALLGEIGPGRDLISFLRNPLLIEAVQQALDGAKSGQEGGIRVVEFTQPGPVERILSARVAALDSPAPDGTAAIVSLHDITAIRRADQLRADFVANASHELRTPLSSLIGFIETLRGPAADDDEARRRFLDIMHAQGNRMARLVADLLSLSRIELNEHSVPTGQVDLPKLLRGVADALQLKAAGRDMRIEIEVPAGAEALPPAQGDADELAQVFQNLIDNAIKYGRRGTPVSVTLSLQPPPAGRPRGRMLSVAIADQGEGIAREHLARLTERFYRIDAARSRDLGGTGLGLAIVKHIVSRHRGRLEIASEPGKGSVFKVLLPAAD